MAKIIQDHKGCIGCGTCVALCPKFWEMRDEDMKAHLIGGRYDREKEEYTLEADIKKEDSECNETAVQSCPVQAIKAE